MKFVSMHSEAEFEAVVARSHREPVAIFKHSNACSLSAEAYQEMQRLNQPDDVPVYMVVVQEARPLSNHIETVLGVRHESPQILLLSEGKVLFSASHRRVTAEAVRAAIPALDDAAE